MPLSDVVCDPVADSGKENERERLGLSETVTDAAPDAVLDTVPVADPDVVTLTVWLAVVDAV